MKILACISSFLQVGSSWPERETVGCASLCVSGCPFTVMALEEVGVCGHACVCVRERREAGWLTYIGC